MKEIVLYGALAKEFGERIKLDVRSVAEAIKALESNFPGKFYKSIEDGWYKVSRKGVDDCIHPELLKMQLGSEEIHIEPVLGGAGGGGGGGQSKGKGIVTAVVGVALIAASIFFAPAAAAGAGMLSGLSAGVASLGGAITYGNIALIGVGLAVSGISTMLSSDPRLRPDTIGSRERPEERASFIFNGAVNNTEQGGPVPLVYGQMKTGSVVISASLDIEDID